MGFPGGLDVKDPALSLLLCKFNPWPENFPIPQVQAKRKDTTYPEHRERVKISFKEVVLPGFCDLGVGDFKKAISVEQF